MAAARAQKHGRQGCRGVILVVTEFEGTLVAQGAGAIGAAAAVTLPAVGNAGEGLFTGQSMHHPQLYDMQLMIEGAGYHGQACTRLLIERPESQVVTLEIVEQG